MLNNGIVRAVGTLNEIKRRFPRQRHIPLPQAVLLPGLVNVHSHLELPPLLDIIRAKAKLFPDWILDLIHAKKELTHKDYLNATANNIRTLLQTGTTAVGDICTHDISPALLQKYGLRTIIYWEFIRMGDHGDFHFPLRSHSNLVKAGLSPHTPYTVSEEVLRDINVLANTRHLQLAMHVAESKDEIRLLQRKKSGLEKLYQFAQWDLSWAPKGTTSFEYLDRIGFLSPRLLAVHAVHVTDNDIKLIKNAKVAIAHCPRSNRELGVGRMPLKKMLDAGITVGLGTDSLASSPNLNMWDEMRYAYQIHRRDGVSAEDILKLATISGAKALGLGKEIGTLEPGKKADIIAVPLPKKNTNDLYSDLLRETKSCIMTMVNGKILFRA